jgi:hypothetical protein
MSYFQDAGKNHNFKIANVSIETVAKFKYLGTMSTNFLLSKVLGLINTLLKPSKSQKHTRIKVYNTLALLTLL